MKTQTSIENLIVEFYKDRSKTFNLSELDALIEFIDYRQKTKYSRKEIVKYITKLIKLGILSIND